MIKEIRMTFDGRTKELIELATTLLDGKYEVVHGLNSTGKSYDKIIITYNEKQREDQSTSEE